MTRPSGTRYELSEAVATNATIVFGEAVRHPVSPALVWAEPLDDVLASSLRGLLASAGLAGRRRQSRCRVRIRSTTKAVQPVWCQAPKPAPLSPWKYSGKAIRSAQSG